MADPMSYPQSTLITNVVTRSSEVTANTRAGVAQQMWALLIVYQLIRTAMVDAIETRPGTDPDRASFATAYQAATDSIITAANITNDHSDDHDILVGGIGRAVLADLLPPRRPRTNVRKVKSPLSKYNKKDPKRPERSTKITKLTLAWRVAPVGTGSPRSWYRGSG
ncbi:MAG: hypothetical protein GEV00_22170 [Actinophytocola sp.]|nr:hypothetical protein [Actinophytocola sp.]